jgi:hypothetical protein
MYLQGQAAFLVVGGDLGCRMKIEAMVLGAQFAFGNGAVVGVEQDADDLALVCGAGGRGASGDCGRQAGQERIFLADGFVGDDGDLTVSG